MATRQGSRARTLGALLVLALLASVEGGGVPTRQARSERAEEVMSSMGRHGARIREYVRRRVEGLDPGSFLPDPCGGDPDCREAVLAPSTQAETSIAVDSTGQHVVVGFNDFRGFTTSPISVSGFAFSDDGGLTFTDGGQLPSPGNDSIAGLRLPIVLGDPEVKYLGGSRFIYFSLLLKRYESSNSLVQTLGLHYSADYGHTWTGPYEIPAATNPYGAVSAAGDPLDAADKEFADVDPDTGRVLVSWSNFTPLIAEFIEISTSFSDDLASQLALGQPPSWSTRRVVGTLGQASIPRFAGGGSNNVYLAWARYIGAYTGNIGFAVSNDNGATWNTPIDLRGAPFVLMDQVLGNDRVNHFPSLDVDDTSGAVYVTYSRLRNLNDGADVMFQSSTDAGVTFSSPELSINARPLGDRAQWFPWITVDQSTGRVHVHYFDQGVDTSGDLTQVSNLYSDDGGATWAPQRPLSDRPFHAGWGNDTSQPNLGDYNQAVAQNGTLYASFAITARPPGGFTDGLPASASFTVPDLEVKVGALVAPDPTLLQLGDFSYTTSPDLGGGIIAAGQQVTVTIPLRNYATNPLYAAAMTGISATLASDTPHVTVTQPASAYPNLAPGATASNATGFVLAVGAGFVPGTPIELELTAVSAGRSPIDLPFTLLGGVAPAVVLLSEDFNGGPPETMPPGWRRVHGAGLNVVPWVIDNQFCGGSRGAFHQNANDGPPAFADPTRWERLFSPVVTVPAGTKYVTFEMDVCYDTEDDPFLPRTGYDGFFLRITDWGPPRRGRQTILRSVLTEAFADVITTGSIRHFPKHLPRNAHPAYFEDMSAWAGDSQGVQRVRMRLPGMAGRQVQLRFEFTQDAVLTCQDVRPGRRCGVMVDNIVMIAH